MRVTDKNFWLGKYVKSYDRTTGVANHNNSWREKYLDKPGLIHFFHVADSPYGEFDMAAIYINAPFSAYQPYLKTSEVINLEQVDNHLKVETRNSVYEFELGDFGLTEDDRQELMDERIFRSI